MKKVKFEKKLSLNKETIARLNEEQMRKVEGGIEQAWTSQRNCSELLCGSSLAGGPICLCPQTHNCPPTVPL